MSKASVRREGAEHGEAARKQTAVTRAGRLIAALVLAGSLAACASPATVAPPPPPPQPQAAAPEPVAPPPPVAVDDGKVRVALLVPLSGRGAAIGQSMLDAAQLAVFDVADGQFLLLPHDTGGTPAGAEAAARDAVTAGARLILGPLFSADAAAVRTVAAPAGVPVLSFSSDRTVAGGGVWVLGFQPQEQVARVVGFATSRGITSFGLLAPATPSGEVVQQSLIDAARQGGGTVTRIERYGAEQQDLTDVVRRFAQRQPMPAPAAAEPGAAATGLPFQAVMLADGGGQLRALATLLPFFDVDPGPVAFLGTGQWEEPGLGREAGLVGGWFAAPPPEARQVFERRYEETYGQKPQRLATLAYDATALAAALVRSGAPEPLRPEALTDPQGFLGADGLFRLLPDGLTERGLAVLQVTRTGFATVDPAPQTFPPRPDPAAGQVPVF